MSIPGSPEFETKAENVAKDLAAGNTEEAATALRNEVLSDARHANAFIKRVREDEPPTGRDEVKVDVMGNIIIHDKVTDKSTYALYRSF